MTEIELRARKMAEEKGFVYWSGGDCPPVDWDGGFTCAAMARRIGCAVTIGATARIAGTLRLVGIVSDISENSC